MAAVVETSLLYSPSAESVSSSVECDLMIDSLQKELQVIRSRLEAIVLDRLPPLPSEGHSLLTGQDGSVNSRHHQSKLSNRSGRLPRVRGNHQLRNRLVATNDAKKNVHLSWEKQQYYIGLVSDREREKAAMQKHCLSLMEQHIMNQLEAVQKRGEKLKRKLQQRLAKEKAISLPPKPVRTRSDQTLIPAHPPIYKSMYYRAVADNYDSKRQLTGSRKRLPVSWSQRSHMLPRVKAIEEGEEKEESNNERSNSWALTAGAAVDDKVVRTQVQRAITPIPYPQFKPLSELLGENSHHEEIQQRSHVARMERLVTAHRQVLYMYELSRRHQRAFQNNLLDLEEETELSFGATPPVKMDTPPLPSCSRDVTLVSIESHSSLPSPSPSPQSLLLPRISPTPLLSLEAAVTNAPIVKEPRQLSSLWRNYTKK